MRLMPLFNVSWKLAKGLLLCSNTMLATFALMVVILYTFACFGMEIITTNGTFEEVGQDIVDRHFDSIPRIMLTLVRFITLDSISDIYGPLIRGSTTWIVAIYFFAVLMLISICLTNLVTGVVVESALTMAQESKDEKRKK